MQAIIADTTPLNYLVLIKAVEILPKLYGGVLIPPAVKAELAHSNTPEQVRAWVAQPVLPENSMQPIAEVLSSKRIEDSTGLRLCVGSDEQNSPMCTTPENSLGANFEGPRRCSIARWILAFSGSLSLVAVGCSPPTC